MIPLQFTQNYLVWLREQDRGLADIVEEVGNEANRLRAIKFQRGEDTEEDRRRIEEGEQRVLEAYQRKNWQWVPSNLAYWESMNLRCVGFDKQKGLDNQSVVLLQEERGFSVIYEAVQVSLGRRWNYQFKATVGPSYENVESVYVRAGGGVHKPAPKSLIKASKAVFDSLPARGQWEVALNVGQIKELVAAYKP